MTYNKNNDNDKDIFTLKYALSHKLFYYVRDKSTYKFSIVVSYGSQDGRIISTIALNI